MTQHAVKQAEEPVAPETKPPAGAMAMCPMAKMCMGMTEKRPSGLLLMLPGVLLIVVGVLIPWHHALDDGQLHPQSGHPAAHVGVPVAGFAEPYSVSILWMTFVSRRMVGLCEGFHNDLVVGIQKGA
jgi:hypothetical protein